MTDKEKFYMDIAKLASSKSKDPKTKVGSVLEKDGRILSIGYNGAPRNFPDELVPIEDKGDKLIDKKNTYMVHSELNCILNYGGSLKDLIGSTLYVTVYPCEECAKALAQVGVSKVVYLHEYRKKEHMEASKRILNYCDIDVIEYLD